MGQKYEAVALPKYLFQLYSFFIKQMLSFMSRKYKVVTLPKHLRYSNSLFINQMLPLYVSIWVTSWPYVGACNANGVCNITLTSAYLLLAVVTQQNIGILAFSLTITIAVILVSSLLLAMVAWFAGILLSF